MRSIIIGDINAVYLRIMTLGQTNAVATRRNLNNQLNNIQKGDLSWPNYMQHFHELCDNCNLAAIDVHKEEEQRRRRFIGLPYQWSQQGLSLVLPKFPYLRCCLTDGRTAELFLD
jgi:hypothetical protein